MFCVFNIHKPLHCTSHDVVAKVRKKLGIKKVGHAGTLDPLAEGVLPICVGNATRLIEYFPSDKRYRAEVTFGATTLTWDAEGEPLNISPARELTGDTVTNLLSRFQGKISQCVPPHAAVHVKGKKLYEYARKGITVELPVRETDIYDIRLVEFRGAGEDHPVAVVDVHCASGTYIRSIAQALGEATGHGAYLSGLVRTSHGLFTLETSVTLEALMASDRPADFCLNPADYLPFPKLDISSAAVTKIRHGMKLQPGEVGIDILNNRCYFLIYENQPVAVASGEETGRLKPLKVFHTNEN